MEPFIKRIVAAVMLLITACSGFSGMSLEAAAETMEEVVVKEAIQIDADDLPANDELFAGYVEKVLYSDLYSGISTYGNVGADRLETTESKAIYSELKGKIETIAAGNLTSTEIAIDQTFTWSASELGVTAITSSNVVDAVGAKFSEVVDINAILKYLLIDCPYDLYWYDKTMPTYTSYSISHNPARATVCMITMQMPVAAEYQDGNIYTMDAVLAKSTEAAKNKAASIVSEYAEASDYEKLVAYKDAICELTAYNYDVGNESAYGNPWQLIWVFDEDADTKVVCEGYSKAFQYLCDLSGLTCYTANGRTASSTSAGDHMWNIVTLEGKNYLVDITNCDAGTIGYPDKLFLAGTNEGNVTDGYTFSLSRDIFYTYRDNQFDLLGEEILTLATENYTVKETVKPVTEVFSDITEGAWYVDEVQYVYDNDIMSGSEGVFTPNGAVTRAMIVETLYKMEDRPEVTDYSEYDKFTDLKRESWWANSVAWAINTGVATGDTYYMLFNPEALVTREQLATFLYRYAMNEGLDTTQTGDLSAMLNADQVSTFAQEPVTWAVGTELIGGIETTNANGTIVKDLAPQVGATRIQLAAVLMRFCEYYDI